MSSKNRKGVLEEGFKLTGNADCRREEFDCRPCFDTIWWQEVGRLQCGIPVGKRMSEIVNGWSLVTCGLHSSKIIIKPSPDRHRTEALDRLAFEWLWFWLKIWPETDLTKFCIIGSFCYNEVDCDLSLF